MISQNEAGAAGAQRAPAAHGISQKDRAIRDGCQSREVTIRDVIDSRYRPRKLDVVLQVGPKVGDCCDLNGLSRKCGKISPLTRNGYFERFPHRR
jgi:hypothetical protein